MACGGITLPFFFFGVILFRLGHTLSTFINRFYNEIKTNGSKEKRQIGR
jgi:hypothetical protein